MKAKTVLWTLALALAAAGGTRAQVVPTYDDHRVTVMHYENASGERGRSEFRYGRDGRIDTVFWTLEDGSRFSTNFLAYDDEGRRREQHRVFSDSLTSREVYTYDRRGRLSAESFERSDGPAGVIAYTWDGERLVAAVCRGYKGWLTCDIAYRYDAEGRRADARITREGEPLGDIAYEYDAAGRLVAEVWDFAGRWSQTFRYDYEPVPAAVYAYASPFVMMSARHRVAGEDYRYGAETGGPSRYEHDAAGRLVRKIFERSDGVRTETTYVHGERGDLMSSHRRHDDGTTTDFEYGFDARGRLVERRGERNDGAACRERYEYDRFGRLVAARYDAMDFWLTGDLVFFHGDAGRLNGGRFTGDRDDSGRGFDADLAFTTDAVGNVLTMRWDFSFGGFQTYAFTYREAP